jgi:hypothetical protein
MKKRIVNCLATTALALILLAVIALLHQASFLFISSVYQTLLANIAIHAGLALIKRFESKYFIVEMLWELGYILAVLTVCGFSFDWFRSTPLWIVIIMGIAVYLIGCAVNIFKINNDLMLINRAIKEESSCKP